MIGPVAGSGPDVAAPAKTGMAPLLRQLITAYDRSGLPPAYLPKDELARGDASESTDDTNDHPHETENT